MHTGQQDVERKGLREVIVGTHVEAVNHVSVGIACSQHQYGRAVSLSAHSPQHVEAIEIRQHYIKDNHVELSREDGVERSQAARCRIDDVTLLGESALQKRGHPGVVLGKQDAHLDPHHCRADLTDCFRFHSIFRFA